MLTVKIFHPMGRVETVQATAVEYRPPGYRHPETKEAWRRSRVYLSGWPQLGACGERVIEDGVVYVYNDSGGGPTAVHEAGVE